MPDNDSGEKTEEPTPRKLTNAREEGQVPISTEVNTAGLLLVGFAGLVVLGPALHHALGAVMRDCIGVVLTWELDRQTADILLWQRYLDVGWPLLAILGLAFLTALVLGFAQAGLVFSLKPLQPKWNRLSPLSGLKRIFGLRGLMRTVFSLVKMVIIVVIAWMVIGTDIAAGLAIHPDLQTRFADLAWILILLGLKLAAVLLVIATFDFLYQRYQHRRDLMMTKQEVKDESKQAEGDPLVKSRIRQIQRQLAQNRMMQEVPQADVVITNPTHVAVALRYDQERMDAPVVVAKGYDQIAQRIKQLAGEAGVVQVENIDLARALAKRVRLGETIPTDFYQQVAEVLGHVYRLRKAAA